MEDEAAGVALLVGQARGVRDMPLDGADPALFGARDGHRLLLDHRLVEVDAHHVGRIGEVGAALAERVSLPKRLRTSRISPSMVFHCSSSDAMSAWSVPCFGGERLVLAADLDLLQLAQRAQAHVEDRLGLHVGQGEARHQRPAWARPPRG
jgi:hypothetical protein